MNIEEIKTEMKVMAEAHADYKQRVDVEKDHLRADKLLCELALLLGHDDLVQDFHVLRKWYA